MSLFGPNPERMGRKGDVAGLLALLFDPDDGLRTRASDALAALGTPAVEPLIGLFRTAGHARDAVRGIDAALAAERALARMADPPVDRLIAALDDGEYWIRNGAAGALRSIGDPRAVEPLIGKIVGPDNAPEYAIRALGWLGDARAAGPLRPLLASQDPRTRAAAAFALGHMGDTASIEALSAATRDPEKSVRDAAAEALRRMDDPRARDAAASASLAAIREITRRDGLGAALEAGTDETVPLPVRIRRIGNGVLSLSADHPTQATVVGGGAPSGARMLKTVYDTCNEAAAAVESGLDPGGRGIARTQVASGLRAMVADMRAEVGLLYTALDPEGVRQFELALTGLESVAAQLERG